MSLLFRGATITPAPVPAPARPLQRSLRPRDERRPRRPHVRFAVGQLGLVLVAVAVYFGVRSITEGAVAEAERNAGWLVDLERGLGLFLERDLQRFALDFDAVLPVVNAIYIWGHWPVIAAVLGWLAWRRRDAYFVYRNALLISGVVGMIIVALFPVAPPRLMDLGFLDTVTLHTEAYRVLQPPSFTNQYAAMPSFHVGWDLLVGIALVREGRYLWVRMVGYALPLLMLVSVVLTGNHYLVDAIVGDAIVLTSLAIARRRALRRQSMSPIAIVPATPVQVPTQEPRRLAG